MESSSDSFLDCAVVAFRLGNVFVGVGNIGNKTIDVLHLFKDGTKFEIGMDMCNLESSTMINANGIGQHLSVRFERTRWYPLGSAVPYGGVDGRKKRHSTNIKAIDTELNLAVSLNKFWWNGHGVVSNG